MLLLLLTIILIWVEQCGCQTMSSSYLSFRVEAGGRTCFFETGKAGNVMEVGYQVVDGQHGELDISLEVFDPEDVKIISDYKKPENSFIKDLLVDGDYTFCLDNKYSTFNSKLVYIYVMMERTEETNEHEAVVTTVDGDGNEVKQVEVLNWKGIDDNGQTYLIEVAEIAHSMSRTLKHVVKARHMLDLYGATKTRDSYLAFEETFFVDMWSSFQITFMFIVGMTQVYMIKNLFKSRTYIKQ